MPPEPRPIKVPRRTLSATKHSKIAFSKKMVARRAIPAIADGGSKLYKSHASCGRSRDHGLDVFRRDFELPGNRD